MPAKQKKNVYINNPHRSRSNIIAIRDHTVTQSEQEIYYSNMNRLFRAVMGAVHVIAFIMLCFILYIGIPLLYDWLKNIF